MHSLVIGHLGWLHRLVILNRAAVHMRVQVSLVYIDWRPFGYTPRSGRTWLSHSSFFSFFEEPP
jgi:hypothetical protein